MGILSFWGSVRALFLCFCRCRIGFTAPALIVFAFPAQSPSAAVVSQPPSGRPERAITADHLSSLEVSKLVTKAVAGDTRAAQVVLGAGAMRQEVARSATSGAAVQHKRMLTTGAPGTFAPAATDKVDSNKSAPAMIAVAARAPWVGGAGTGTKTAMEENAYCGKGNLPHFGSKDGPADLPKACYYTGLDGTPSPGKQLKVAAGGDLAGALDRAQCGDTVMLASGATFPITAFPKKNCDDQHYITVRTDTPDVKLPPEDTRISPAWAGVASLPGRPPFAQPQSGPAKLMATIPVTVSDGITFGDHYRFIGIEWAKPPQKPIFRMVTTEGANHIIFDRNWFHAVDGEELAHGIGMNKGAMYIAVIHSYLNGFTCTARTGTCTDATAVGGGNGNEPMGTFKIFDNFLEASGENIFYGGAAATFRPEDIEIRGNHLFKPMFWNPSHPSHSGPTPITKNLFELKNANRVLFEGNYLENCWGGFSQVGPAILLTPRNQPDRVHNRSLCPTCSVTNVTIRYVWIRKVNQVLQLANPKDLDFAAGGNSYSIHDLVAEGLDYPECGRACGGSTNLLNGGAEGAPAAAVMHDVSINHITFVSMKRPTHLLIMGGPPLARPADPHMSNITWTNTIADAGEYGPWPTGGSATTNCAAVAAPDPKKRFEACWNSGSSFAGNVLAGGTMIRQGKMWPDGNFFPFDQTSIGYVNLHGGLDGDYHLAPTSKYKGKGTDGRDPGADVDAVLKATSGVR